MMKFILGGAKLLVLTLVILLISQIPVGQKRICDYVRDVTLSPFVQGPVVWIADKFDFSDGKHHHSATAQADRGSSKRSNNATGSRHDSESDTDQVSAFLKRR